MLRSTLARLAVATLPLALPAATALPAAAVGSAQAVVAAPPTLRTDIVASGLVVPWDVGFLPDGQMVVTERPGRIRVYASGSPGAALVRTVTVPNMRASGEAGLMGLAVDVDFATNRSVYVCASRDEGGIWVNQVLRYTVAATGSWSGPVVIRGGMAANTSHNGCALEMDASGLLWVGMGDAGVASRAQDRASLNGKVLRMTRAGGVPADNPVIAGVRDVVYSMGHRNPQGLAIRPGTRQMYEVEHGPSVNDEVNLLQPGGNFGWPCYTGDGVPQSTAGCGPASSYLPPLWASGSSTIATSGASFTKGAQWQDFQGSLFVSTLKEQDLRRFPVGAGGTSLGSPQTLFDTSFGRLRASVPGPGGQLYLTTSNGSGDRVVRVSAATPTVTRIGGADRYAVAAAVSASAHPTGASDVVVATGAVFPDALTGSALGGRLGMPVLLTARDVLPAATRAELARLGPQRIWVLGGPASVSEVVRSALVPYASTGSVTRIGGRDRYEVAASVSARWTPLRAPVVIASGEVFADALSGGPAAAVSGGPLLLVSSRGIPAATAAELRRVAPARIDVLGGPGTVPASVLTALDGYTTGPVTRVGGADRYAVAQNVARRFWTAADVWVASGETFADGLTGGAAAGHARAPLLLARSVEVPASTGLEVLRLAPDRVRMVGGPATLGSAVEATLRRLVATP